MTDDFKNLWVKDQEDNFAKRWVNYWRPPARPTKEEINFLRNFIKKQKNEQEIKEVMILGSTTEYRDLMFELGLKPTVIDLSADNYNILSNSLKLNKDYRSSEVFFEQKWQSISVNKKFDLVLGHFALLVNPFELWDDIFKSIYSHLNEGGLFITNNWIIGSQEVNMDDILTEYNEKWQKDYTLFGSMMPKIYIAARDGKDGETPFSSVCNIIEKANTQGKISKEDFQDYQNMGYKNFNFDLYISTEEKFREFSEKYFDIIDKVILSPYPNSDLMPEWILRKK